MAKISKWRNNGASSGWRRHGEITAASASSMAAWLKWRRMASKWHGALIMAASKYNRNKENK